MGKQSAWKEWFQFWKEEGLLSNCSGSSTVLGSGDSEHLEGENITKNVLYFRWWYLLQRTIMWGRGGCGGEERGDLLFYRVFYGGFSSNICVEIWGKWDAVIWRENISDGECVQFEMPVLHSSNVELRTDNTGLKLMKEVWADGFKTMRVDAITSGVSMSGEEEKFP